MIAMNNITQLLDTNNALFIGCIIAIFYLLKSIFFDKSTPKITNFCIIILSVFSLFVSIRTIATAWFASQNDLGIFRDNKPYLIIGALVVMITNIISITKVLGINILRQPNNDKKRH